MISWRERARAQFNSLGAGGQLALVCELGALARVRVSPLASRMNNRDNNFSLPRSYGSV